MSATLFTKELGVVNGCMVAINILTATPKSKLRSYVSIDGEVKRLRKQERPRRSRKKLVTGNQSRYFCEVCRRIFMIPNVSRNDT